MFYCFFEQSGIFKNEFIKLGYLAVDVDISNKFDQTDILCDLFHEISDAYDGYPSIFDGITHDDTIIAFFPCIKFSQQFKLLITCNAKHLINCSDGVKLETAMSYHQSLSYYYEILCKLFLVCINRGLKLIVENPYRIDTYLSCYFPIKPVIIDSDRRDMGDYFEKPTQYFFINCKPTYNFILEGVDIKATKKVNKCSGFSRSLISSDYASRFIREFIL